MTNSFDRIMQGLQEAAQHARAHEEGAAVASYKGYRNDIEACLRGIRDSVDAIARYVEGITEAQFLADTMRQDAVVRRIGMIGGAVGRIIKADPGYAMSLSDLPLAAARRMRNKVIYDYDRVGLNDVWDTAKNDVPDLGRKVSETLANQTVQPPPNAR